MPPPLEPLEARRIGLIADAHVHAGQGRLLPPEVVTAFRGVDVILALGDLGEAAGLDALAEIAPVTGVRGADDAVEDPRLAAPLRRFAVGGLTLGAVFDAGKHGLLASSDPLQPVADFPAAIRRNFGGRLDLLLCASTHTPCTGWVDGVLVVNPGSPTLPAGQRIGTVAVLTLSAFAAQVEHVPVQRTP